MKEAYLYQKLPENKVQCRNCGHYCVLPEQGVGVCGVRKNIKGKLYSLVYGKTCALDIDPIEKKPFFHFLPGTQSLSLAAVGCNFACLNCQNWQISQGPKIAMEKHKKLQNRTIGRNCNNIFENEINKEIYGKKVAPEKVVDMALKNKLPSISYTYTEPAVFSEYALDIMKLAKKKGIKNNWVSNGFWSKELLAMVVPYLDAANIDLKSFDDEFYQKYCGGRLQPVLNTLRALKKKRVWLEITTLVIPTLNDSEEIFSKIARFVKNLGEETPWHISRFSSTISWRMQSLSDTPLETLKKAWQIGKDIGLKYVYTGNVPGIDSEHTYCPKCNAKMIERIGYTIKRFDQNGQCAECGESLNLILK